MIQGKRRQALGRWAALATVAVAFASQAQELEIAVSPTPVGSGARAAGMADAFVAIADDATAASWNPAGLVQLELPELSLVGSWNALSESFSARYHPEVDGSYGDSNLDINYLSVVYPIPKPLFGKNATLALSYQRKYDFSRDFDFAFNSSSVSRRGTVTNSFLTLEFLQDGGLSTVTPSFALELTHRLSVGVALNLWRSTFLSENGWQQDQIFRGLSMTGGVPGTFYSKSVEEYKNFRGENLTLGGLWSITDKWSLGVRYDTAFNGAVDYEKTGATVRLSLPTPGSPSFLNVVPARSKEKREVRFPDSLALGLAYRVNDRLTFSMDVTRTDWNDFYVKRQGGQINSLVDFSNLRNPWTRPHFKPSYTVRFGAEYVFIPKVLSEKLSHLWTLRGGLFYDEEPATSKSESFRFTDDRGTGEPDSFYGFTAGVGLLVKHRVNIDLAYQLRYGKGVNTDFIRGVPGFEEDVYQHRMLLSTVVYFK